MFTFAFTFQQIGFRLVNKSKDFFRVCLLEYDNFYFLLLLSMSMFNMNLIEAVIVSHVLCNIFFTSHCKEKKAFDPLFF